MSRKALYSQQSSNFQNQTKTRSRQTHGKFSQNSINPHRPDQAQDQPVRNFGQLFKKKKPNQARAGPQETKTKDSRKNKEIILRPLTRQKFAESRPLTKEKETQVGDSLTKNSQNRDQLVRMFQLREEKGTMTEQPNSRKSILRAPNYPPRRTVHWTQIEEVPEVPLLNQVIRSNNECLQKKKQTMDQIRQKNAYLLDFFEINDVYLLQEVDVVGVVDQINDRYAVMLVKVKNPQKESSTHKNKSQREKEKKRQILAIGLMKPLEQKDHIAAELKEVQKKHPEISIFVHVPDPERVFLDSLPQQSVHNSSQK